MNVLTLPSRPISEQIAAVEKGLPSNTLALLAELMELPKISLIEGLKLVQRTVTAREKKGERFSAVESERLFRVIRARTLARNVFTTDAAVAEWMNSPERSLGNKSPLELLATDLGSQKVENVLKGMMHGVPL